MQKTGALRIPPLQLLPPTRDPKVLTGAALGALGGRLAAPLVPCRSQPFSQSRGRDGLGVDAPSPPRELIPPLLSLGHRNTRGHDALRMERGRVSEFAVGGTVVQGQQR